MPKKKPFAVQYEYGYISIQHHQRKLMEVDGCARKDNIGMYRV
ncbi:hypothetical protein BACPEC_01702 [[Bacteroides] pectinophilus ATCC 43243]|uniref:Uncharacterized protein n=1 Tax=[Bacteroides] pectinophilus ATCC 43243 TaxID=483218 RepID=B7ARJ8_9FIRM|nr:hypothetical protein BACPEC_01702 [[Bacteroides] pectinophilus ATCC 43243]